MKNYQNKLDYITNRQQWTCAILLADKANLLYKKDITFKQIFPYKTFAMNIFYCNITDLHHRFHKSKWAIKKYPLFIDSMLNLIGVNNATHLRYPSALKISEKKAEKYERFLEKHLRLSDFVNGKT